MKKLQPGTSIGRMLGTQAKTVSRLFPQECEQGKESKGKRWGEQHTREIVWHPG